MKYKLNEGRPVGSFNFKGPATDEDGSDVLAECERQMRPVVHEIVQSAVTAGWSPDDVLLTLVEISWDMYESRRELS
ncbi:MAG TPA: hypothetical protein VNS34_16725 [Rhizobiaceae bacterium]|nr:hypothetical protein [Rhizobiaceae bacterium]